MLENLILEIKNYYGEVTNYISNNGETVQKYATYWLVVYFGLKMSEGKGVIKRILSIVSLFVILWCIKYLFTAFGVSIEGLIKSSY